MSQSFHDQVVEKIHSAFAEDDILKDHTLRITPMPEGVYVVRFDPIDEDQTEFQFEPAPESPVESTADALLPRKIYSGVSIRFVPPDSRTITLTITPEGHTSRESLQEEVNAIVVALRRYGHTPWYVCAPDGKSAIIAIVEYAPYELTPRILLGLISNYKPDNSN